MSDPQKRSLYNQHGMNAQTDGVFVDPQQFFKQQFGGDKFVDLIGEISIARDFKEAMSPENSTEPAQSSEERALQRKQRVSTLVGHLIQKLSLYTDAFPYPSQDALPIGTTMEHLSKEALSSFRILAQVEVDVLKNESYGVELLHSIGYTYTLKADQWLAILTSKNGHLFQRTWSWTSRFTNGLREKAHIIAETVGTVKTAYDLQSSFTKLQEIEKKATSSSGDADQDGKVASTQDWSQEDQELKAKLEQEAATKGMEALWRGSKLEVESVLREVCDETLGDVACTDQLLVRRATALKVLGEVYSKASV